ncbi:MAG: class I SAM-dependent methyltransferase [Alphaproteobacteria bacterium]|nr:class I SAM-dependent methyltransferase [Alphaproteobacteria bacterium]
MRCRHCLHTLEHVFLDLGSAPPSNAYLTREELEKPEAVYPLKLYVCGECWLVQTQDFVRADELFRADYAYFSSTSKMWMGHAKNYCEEIIQKLNLGKNSFVVEVACNDGYLLKNFMAEGIPCLGIEPAAAPAQAARKLGIEVKQEFFGEKAAAALPKADLVIGNNVYAHVPDINDFTRGLKAALKNSGTITLEFPHVLELIKHVQFDTVYHEHFSYLSLFTVSMIFAAAGLKVYDVETLSTHGGSLRVYGCHANDPRKISKAVENILQQEEKAGLINLKTYQAFQEKAEEIKNNFLSFLQEQKSAGRKVAGYGAAAKGNTLLNYAGVKADLIPYICDAAPSKQGKYLPGSHIPVLPPSAIAERKPDIIVIFPWNIAEEIRSDLAYARAWNAQFVTAIPGLRKEAA